jgi:hypothetical protein
MLKFDKINILNLSFKGLYILAWYALEDHRMRQIHNLNQSENFSIQFIYLPHDFLQVIAYTPSYILGTLIL